MTLTADEVKRLNRARLDDSARQRAEEFKAKADADAANGYASFTRRHSGQLAIARNSVFYDCAANQRLLEQWIQDNGLLVTDRTLELAYQANKHRLAEHPALEKPYKRRTDTAQSRIAPQVRTYAPEPVRAPYTKQQVLKFSKEQLSAAVRMYGVLEINRVIREEE